MLGVLFVYKIKPCIGGVETHQTFFIDHFFIKSKKFLYVVEKQDNGCNIYIYNHKICDFKNICSFKNHLFLYQWIEEKNKKEKHIVFFLNDPWWIEDVPVMRNTFPYSLIVMRSGGNDVEKAPCNLGKYSYTERRNKYKNYINSLNFIIANSNYSISRLKKLGVFNEKIIKIRGGVNTSLITNLRCIEKKSIEELRKKILQDKHFIILYACRFVEFKGVIESLLALYLSDIVNDVQIVFIGDGPQKNNIESFCLSHFSLSQIHFIGAIDNSIVLKYIMASDIVVNCSIELERTSGDGLYIHTETMGRTMMEAVSVGTHIIATNVGGTSELFQENANIGLLINPNIQNITTAFNTVPQLVATPVILKTDYSWSQVFSKYEKIIHDYAKNSIK